jgi:formyltetrahydrofolate deformylase
MSETPSNVADTARLLVSCQDQPGIVAAITGFLRDYGMNIVQSDANTGAVLQRAELASATTGEHQ